MAEGKYDVDQNLLSCSEALRCPYICQGLLMYGAGEVHRLVSCTVVARLRYTVLRCTDEVETTVCCRARKLILSSQAFDTSTT